MNRCHSDIYRGAVQIDDQPDTGQEVMIMAKDPAVLFYTADFLVGTMTMSDAQVGRYIRLLCLQHQKGHLPEDAMLKVCGGEYDEEVLSNFIVDENGLYYNKRMDEEIAKRAKGSDASRANGAKGGRPTKPDKPEEPEAEGKIDPYKNLFDHYMSLDLVKHRAITTEMRNAIDTARRRGGYDWDQLKTMLDRHAQIVELTAGNGNYKVKMRPLVEFFGQKVQGGTALICSEYADDGAKWLWYKDGNPKRVASKQDDNANPFFAAAERMRAEQ